MSPDVLTPVILAKLGNIATELSAIRVLLWFICIVTVLIAGMLLSRR